MENTTPAQPQSVFTYEQSSAFHNFIVPSQPPEANSFPSGENATDSTHPLCPGIEIIHEPLSKFHNFSVLSALPEANRFPSGENATESTISV
jgi:hypothetical protein